MADVKFCTTHLELQHSRNVIQLLRVLDFIPSHNEIQRNLFGILYTVVHKLVLNSV
jgi:hypothetical protein